ncbi:winged helix-turn-helix domain-containing protein [Calditrichota bacterium LG25]
MEENKKIIMPTLIINGPTKKQVRFKIQPQKTIIGRFSKVNDIALEPDEQKLVTRYMHCSIEYRNGIYWLVDNDSKNGTFLKRNNIITRVRGEIKLENLDLILIMAKINSQSEPEYWQIEFVDPQATDNAGQFMNDRYIEYDWLQAKLFLICGSKRKEISGLSPPEHKLLRYMDQRNKNNGNVPVMCTYDELISAIWEESSETRSKNDINHLIWGLRKKIENDPQNPQFLQNIRGMGYRLITNPN